LRALAIAMGLLMLSPVLFAVEETPPGDATHGAAQPAHPEGQAHHQEPPFLGIPRWILKMVNMLLFFGFLAWLLVGPVKKAFRERAETIRQRLAEARERDAKADQMASDIAARLSKLEGEVGAILKRAQEEGERQKQELIAAANEESEKILRSARGEVEARIRLARKELTDYAGELAAQRAHQLLQQSLTDADRRKLFEESLTSIPEDRS